MAVNKNSNGYTFFFAIAMVVVVGAILAITSVSLKERQQQNDADKKRMDILGAIKVESTRQNAADLFSQFVVERISVDYSGNLVEQASGKIDPNDKQDPFNIDVKKDYRSSIKGIVKTSGKNPEELENRLANADVNYPVFKCVKNDTTLYVCPMVGTGLWGPIWGYVALEEDFQTIYGAKFDHKTETPGLGAEIKEDFFTVKFEGKELNLEDPKTMFSVLKGGAVTNEHSVDGITGGTITSKGVDEMLNRTLPVYVKYFTNANDQRAER
ncbi:NADH:ubiquinone reductase (Na(+)-transporting) subunit C [Sanyastnella coralliicola]|uniref:NADH:ubiquinone reductase (Na(+)-transporting) subunit C n=1 Tax=Sanyastnella coralliicola TaxID=3069118 RepID=UPI0027BA3822|nr:NADH:ubiquinone reductase (Na(+)-transporting) subunit C [Longitalea sp. SCSIO 12813]